MSAFDPKEYFGQFDLLSELLGPVSRIVNRANAAEIGTFGVNLGVHGELVIYSQFNQC